MIKNISNLQRNAKHARFALRLTEALRSKKVSPTPTAFASAFNRAHHCNFLKPHTVRKWLLGMNQPRSATLLLVTNWLNVEPSFLICNNEVKFSENIFLEFDDSEDEMMRNYLSLTELQKVLIRKLVDTLAIRNL